MTGPTSLDLARALIAVEGFHASARARLAHGRTPENCADAADDLRQAARILDEAGETESAVVVRDAADRIHTPGQLSRSTSPRPRMEGIPKE